VADGEGICWREWLASRITTGRVIRGGFSRWGGRVRLGWGMDGGEARRLSGWLARYGVGPRASGTHSGTRRKM